MLLRTYVVMNSVDARAEWQQSLEEYVQQHPRTRLVDSFSAVKSLMTREDMLKTLADPVTLHHPIDGRLDPSTAELDALSCAAPVQTPLRQGVQGFVLQHVTDLTFQQFKQACCIAFELSKMHFSFKNASSAASLTHVSCWMPALSPMHVCSLD